MQLLVSARRLLGLTVAAVLQPLRRPYLALLLLLCLTRTLLPEAWILALHRHEHTSEEVAFAPKAQVIKGKALLTTRHTHCQTEQFYHASFQPGVPVLAPLPPLRLSYQPLAVPVTLGSLATLLRRTALRGPPLG